MRLVSSSQTSSRMPSSSSVAPQDQTVFLRFGYPLDRQNSTFPFAMHGGYLRVGRRRSSGPRQAMRRLLRGPQVSNKVSGGR